MLKELKIKNFVLVEELTLSLCDQLTILTGETGAGKSVIAGAIHAVLGEQIKGDVFYDKSKNVAIEASFDTTEIIKNPIFAHLVDEYEVELTGDEIFFSRELKPDGRSSIFINGRKSTNNIVKEFRNALLDFHSQRDQQTLFDEDTQLYYLDNYADLLPKRQLFAEAFQQWNDTQKKLNKLIDEAAKNAEKVLLYRYQINEIEAANIKINEEAELDAEHHLLSGAKEILENYNEMRGELFESDRTVFDILAFYKNRLQNFCAHSKLIADTVENLNNSISALHDVATCTRYIEDEIAIDESRLEAVEQRIKTIYDLKTKYKKDIPALLEYAQEMQKFVENFSCDTEKENQLKNQIASLQKETIEIANDLHNKRCQASKSMKNQVIESLKNLAIPDADFDIIIEKICAQELPELQNLLPTGLNKIKYVFSANKGTPLQELKATISGGELSRLLLVIKSILAKKLPARTIIFDEIDSGIGGNTANMLGSFIGQLAQNHQILCISHLPQVAVLADKHIKIEKINSQDKSLITLKNLNEQDQKNEIARMLAGDITQTALEHAEEMLRKKIINYKL